MDFGPEMIVSEEEKDILQEIMNIAFGNAAAELAEVINIFVVLSVPYIKVLKAEELPSYIHDEIRDYNNISIVEQNFWGKFKGSALLVYQSGAGKELIAILGEEPELPLETGFIDVLEKETLMEVGNILIGACVGKIVELLGDIVTYSPPRVIIEKHPNDAIPQNLFNPDCSAIVMKTVFRFDDRDLHGFLFLVTSQESIVWLKQSLSGFMEQYE